MKNRKISRATLLVLCALLLFSLSVSGCGEPEEPGQGAKTGGESPEGVLLYEAALLGDGSRQKILLDDSRLESEHDLYLDVVGAGGELLWRREAGIYHAGWTSIFLVFSDEGARLLEYRPDIRAGVYTWSYRLSAPDGEGGDRTVEDGQVIFTAESLNRDELKAFLERLNALLSKAELLLSTDGHVIPGGEDYLFGSAENPVRYRELFYTAGLDENAPIDERIDTFLRDGGPG